MFQWRGITAFRLLDYVADGQEQKAVEYLDWASKNHLTVVRVLAMLDAWFDLTPQDGRRALPRLLELAAARNIYVEVVALAGTLSNPVNIDEQVREIGKILERHPNGLLELANEPGHPTQHRDVHDSAVLAKAAAGVPEVVPRALGSVEYGDGFAQGSYITWHVPRAPGDEGWGHVRAISAGAAMIDRWKKPAISDEPIGAGAEYQPGRRDNDPNRFRAAALMTRLAGMGATFHYEGGLQATIPSGVELGCFNAWNEAWTILPADVEQKGTFTVAGSGAVDYRRIGPNEGWVLVLPPATDHQPLPGPDWSVSETRRLGGVTLFRVTRQPR